MSKTLFDNMPLRKQDLSHTAIYLFRLSTTLFVICASFLVISDMLLGVEIGRFTKVALQFVLFAAVVTMNFNRLSWRIGFPANTLDEWELKYKADTEMIAYRVIAVMTLVSMITAILIFQYHPGFMLGGEQMMAIAILWMIAVFVLPLAIISWRIKPLVN